MAQKKKASVGASAEKAVKAPAKSSTARTKPTAAKKAAVKAPASKKVAARTTKSKSRPTTSTKAAKPTAKKAVASKSAAPKSAATKPAVKKTAAKAAPAKKAAVKPAARKAAVKAKAPAGKTAASNKSKIAAAAQLMAARRSAASSKKAERPKAVAAAAPAPVKRSPTTVGGRKVPANQPIVPPAKPSGTSHGFKLHEYIVYPAHGVGQIIAIEEQDIAGMTLELFVITFDKDKMTVRVPTAKVDAMRKLSEPPVVAKAMHTLKGRARVKRTMWSRRAQEYENKINSGDLIAISEVVRDLYRSETQPEQSYSERQLYEAALDRMSRELAAVEKIDERGATQRITDVLSKSAKGRREAEEEKAEAEAAAAENGTDGDAEAA